MICKPNQNGYIPFRLLQPMIEGIRLHAQLRPVWEQVSPALGKKPRSSCFARNPDILIFQGTKKKS